MKPLFITAVGKDDAGYNFIRHCHVIGIRCESIIQSTEHSTGTYIAILDETGDLFTTIADMSINDIITPDTIPIEKLKTAELVIIDGNMLQETIFYVCKVCAVNDTPVPVLFECTSVHKCIDCLSAWVHGYITFITPSTAELLAMVEHLGYHQSDRGKDAYEKNIHTDLLIQQCQYLLNKIDHSVKRQIYIILKRGARGVMIACRTENSSIVIHHLSAGQVDSIVNTSGAGDSLVGAMSWSLLQRRDNVETKGVLGSSIHDVVMAVRVGMRAAELTLQSQDSVSSDITIQRLSAV
jgi:pseudouridine kinase